MVSVIIIALIALTGMLFIWCVVLISYRMVTKQSIGRARGSIMEIPIAKKRNIKASVKFKWGWK
jgi:hypothetical protein